MSRRPVLPSGFTWERGPFSKCARCGEIAFGFLGAGHHVRTMRCSKCRYEIRWPLPEVDKRVIYLDQNAFSLLFNVRAKTKRLPKGHEAFSQAFYDKVKRAVLLQQAVFPHSDLHSEETIVFYDAAGLRDAYEQIGGDMPLERSRTVEIAQIEEFARAYRENREPMVNLSPDEVLRKPRNDWLPDVRIRVNIDYSRFAGGIRRRRDMNHAEMTELYARWKESKFSYKQALENELSCFGRIKWEVYWTRLREVFEAGDRGDLAEYVALVNEPIFDEKRMIAEVLGLDRDDEIGTMKAIREFWHWERNREIPVHAVSCRLWAALAHRFGGRQKHASPGTSTDIRAISTYGPYMDAMFVDKEFATIIGERRDIRDLLNSRIFSFANGDELLAYLDDVANQASDEVRENAEIIYGAK